MTEPGAFTWRVLRLSAALFCGATMAYAFTASSAFAYQQFITPRVFSSVGLFADWHVVLTWLWFACVLVTVWRDLAAPGPVRRLAVWFVAGTAVLVAWNTVDPVLPSLESGARSLLIGTIAAVPMLVMALIDHLRSAPFLREQAARVAPAEGVVDGLEDRLFAVCGAATLLVVAIYTLWTSITIAGRFEPDLLTT